MTPTRRRRSARTFAALAFASLVLSNAGTAVADPGQLDLTFGHHGSWIHKLGNHLRGYKDEFDVANTVAIAPDGRIWVAGSYYRRDVPESSGFLIKFDRDGHPRHAPGRRGVFCCGWADTAVAVQPDGKPVVAGYTSEGNDSRFIVARRNEDRSADPTFSHDGETTVDFGSGPSRANAIAIDGSGRLIVAGMASNGIDGDMALARLTAGGKPDTTFGVGGRVVTDLGGDEAAIAVAIQPDGRIVVAGSAGNGSDADFALARYLDDGTLDPSFGLGGHVLTDFGSGDDVAHALALQPDGAIVASGEASNGSDADFAVARYLDDGTLDLHFGVGGLVRTDFGGHIDRAYGVALQSDGRILVVGRAGLGNLFVWGIARYRSNGSLDHSYGDGGTETIQLRRNGRAQPAMAVALQGKDLAVVAGTCGGHLAVARLLPN